MEKPEAQERRIYRAKGRPRQVGYQLGRLVGPDLETKIARYIEHGPGKRGLVAWDKLRRDSLLWLETLSPRFQEEIAGLAEGAGLPLQRIAEWCYVDECSPGGCSAFVGNFSGRLWLARNNDLWVPDLWGYATIREVEGFLPTVTFGLGPEPFTGTGINRERLWLHYNYLPAWDAPGGDLSALAPYVLLTTALETCRSLGEVEAFLHTNQRTGGMMIFAVDGKDETCVVFECDCTTFDKREPQEGWLVGTNHWHAHPPVVDSEHNGGSRRRCDRIRELLRAIIPEVGEGDLPWALVRVLADPEVEARGEDSGTVYANVVCPSTGELWYTLGGYPAASQGNWQRLAWPWG
jgi:hypothetical protein